MSIPIVQTGSVPSIAEPVAASDSGRWLFGIVVLLSAFLLFQVQLITAKYILPWFGGTPGVWTTCMLFFQVELLLGYAYAHGIASKFIRKKQAKLHISLLLISAAVLVGLAFFWRAPILPGISWKPSGYGGEVRRILGLLLISIGLPFFLLSTTGPLLQRWFSLLYPNRSPYPLYALSNFGSLAGLLSYPFIMEPLLRMPVQAWTWTMGYLAFAAGCIICAITIGRLEPTPHGRNDQVALEAAPSLVRRAKWVMLSMIASVLLLATTNVICQEVAVIPLLWALPLSVYLLSFVLCFAQRRFYIRGMVQLGFGVAAWLLVHWGRTENMGVRQQISILVFAFFVCCMFCHGELYRRRPGPAHLTSFYLSISLGGALGGVFVSLIAPHIFSGFWEFWLGIVACYLIMFGMLFRNPDPWLRNSVIWVPVSIVLWTWALAVRFNVTFLEQWQYAMVMALAAVTSLIAILVLYHQRGTQPRDSAPVIRITRLVLLASAVAPALVLGENAMAFRQLAWAGRNFYGVLLINRTVINPNNPAIVPLFGYALLHGHTLHGFQLENPRYERLPTSYYAPASGIGITFRNQARRLAAEPERQNLNVGAIGLGVGTISAYGRSGDSFRFYEINDQVIRIAMGEHGFFSFLRSCPSTVSIVPGDARISLERELQSGQRHQFDVLVVDAFNSDAIPLHLLTIEAMQLYLQHLRDDQSVIAVHISNNSLDLVPVVAGLAEHLGLKMERVFTPGGNEIVSKSEWMLLSRDASFFARPELVAAARVIPQRRFPLWTDDYSNLAQILR